LAAVAMFRKLSVAFKEIPQRELRAGRPRTAYLNRIHGTIHTCCIQRNPTKGIERDRPLHVHQGRHPDAVAFKEIPQRELRVCYVDDNSADQLARYIGRNPRKGIESLGYALLGAALWLLMRLVAFNEIP
jgi:hypothetical protein